MSKIAACLITKNSASTIEACLNAIRAHVDEINIYDTGSEDDTLELLERMNEQTELHVEAATGRFVDATTPEDVERVCYPLAPISVERGEWRDDFAWAREQSYAMCSEDIEWTTWLDDDDIVEGAHNLRQLAATAAPELDGFIVFYDYARDEGGRCVCQLWRERLVRRGIGYRWLNPVHEVLVPPDRPARLASLPPELIRYVHNRPPDRYPPDRNLKILLAQREQAIADGEPVTPRTLAYLGTELMAKGDYPAAIPWLQEYVNHPEALWGDERAQMHHKLAMCLVAIGNPHAAIEVEMLALRERDDWAENEIGLAQAFERLGQWPRAERHARRALELGVPQTPLIINPLELTLLPWLTIAIAAANQARGEDAQRAMQHALQLAPDSPFVQARAYEIGELTKQNEIAGAVMLLRETLVRHDENLKAWHLLEHAVPYVIAGRPEIVHARAEQRDMVAHYLDPAEYERWYRDEPKESTVADELVPAIGDYIPRAQRLLEGLRAQEQALGRKPRLLDLGCNDMWLACYLWLQGRFVVDGVELNRQSVEKGRARMATFDAPGKLVHGNLHQAKQLLAGRRYDAISLFEVIEHVPDVDATLATMEELLQPGGVIYLSTPNGAYERGAIDGWARVERKGHLRAITVEDLADTLSARGKLTAVELQHDERVTFAAYQPNRRHRKQRIVLYAGGGWEPWSPESIRTTGLGGSETALCQVAIRLAQRGHKVTVYSGATPGFYGGALFRPFTAWDPTDDPDLLVLSRLPHVLDNPRLGAKHTALWCHDHSYPGQLEEERASKLDSVIVLSDWQRDRFARLYPHLEGKLRIIRNGIALAGTDGTPRFPDAKRPFVERARRLVYSSSADRGLDIFLQLWPRIRELTSAELHVFYGWEVFDRVALQNPALHAYKQKILAMVAELGGEDGGIFMRGRVGQDELYAEMSNARAWAYPTAFLETSCIGAMEARACGLPIVTSDLGALHETVGEHGLLLPWGPEEDEPATTTGEYQDRFVRAVVDMLDDQTCWTHWHQAARAAVDELDWEHRVSEWEQLLPQAKLSKRNRAKALARR